MGFSMVPLLPTEGARESLRRSRSSSFTVPPQVLSVKDHQKPNCFKSVVSCQGIKIARCTRNANNKVSCAAQGCCNLKRNFGVAGVVVVTPVDMNASLSLNQSIYLK